MDAIEYDVAIIGAGFAGIGAGIKLKELGDTSFIIFEKASEVGGTWRDNTYPGCACDIPSMLYSYSFEANPDWNCLFSKQKEIFNYIKHCILKYDIEQHIQYNTEIKHLEFQKEIGRWKITDQQNNSCSARMVISASGPFNAAKIPKIKGRDLFGGETFHSLNWNHDYNLAGKNVAVIGTGASAIQFVPEIAPIVKSLYIFQRTAPYVIPKMDKPFEESSKTKYRRFPKYQKFWREFIYWFLEYRGRSQYADGFIRKQRMREAINHLHNQIKDSNLRKILTPDYTIGCKRVLVSDDYYPTLLRDNVTLLNEGASEITDKGILMGNGDVIELDAIIYGTGFHAAEFHKMYTVTGLSGGNLFDKWNAEGAEAYYGMTIHEYPNLCIVVGPNTGLGHNSILHMMESQYNYIMDYWSLLKSQNSASAYFNIKKKVQDDYNVDIQEKLSSMVWNDGGCDSYYLKDGKGKNTSIWPGSTVRYRKLTKKVNIIDYEVITKESSILEE